MSNQTFKEGDNVFHAAYGWGKVMSIDEEDKLECPVEVEFYNWGCETFTDDGRTMPGYPMVLSFTEYTLEGFSLERPEEAPKLGDIVWGKGFHNTEWSIGHYLGKQHASYKISSTPNALSYWLANKITTINPYTNEK
jgi:hypothetical protein